MPVKSRKKNGNGSTNGMSMKMMKRKKPLNSEILTDIEPLTENQRVFFEEYAKDKNMFAYGCAGTGKTFIALYLALKDVLNENTPYEKVYIVRSLVSTREIGFLPGDHEDKSSLYQIPYKNMVKYMFEMPSDDEFDKLYYNLKAQETISFWSTSFIRGTTLDNAIILIDEMQNLNFHELDSIITRVGQDSKIVFCGDVRQSDLVKTHERNGIIDFMRIIETMEEFATVEFQIEDIVRSGLVRSYLISKTNLGL
jgi:phosphate starvation-inducible PhoH-like protein